MDRLERLQQATCAIVRPAGTGPERVIGTGWLAMSPGTLVTAAHVVSALPPDDVRIRFPGSPTRAARVVAGPVFDRS